MKLVDFHHHLEDSGYRFYHGAKDGSGRSAVYKKRNSDELLLIPTDREDIDAEFVNYLCVTGKIDPPGAN